MPLAIGGAHGQPLPGSKMHDGGLPEKDHQAGTTGGKTGIEIASLAATQLGMSKELEYDDRVPDLPRPPPTAEKSRRLERTASGTTFMHDNSTTSRGQTVQGLGMVPITRQASQPGYAGFFGGSAPSGADAEEGRLPAHSQEEEEEREKEREKRGLDPWAVRFDPGERTNPKVSEEASLHLDLL